MGAGYMMIGVGIVLLFCVKKRLGLKPITITVLGIHFCIIGILMCVFHYTENDVALTYTIAFGVGLLFLWAAGEKARRLIICTKKVDGIFINGQPYHGGKGIVKYSPMFAYKIGNNVYKNQSGEIYSGFKLSRKYKEGATYPIYVDPKNPYIFITKRYLSLSALNLIFWGILFICLPFILL